MIPSPIRVLGHLTRLDTCCIAFAAVAGPVYYVTGDLHYAVTNSLPVLTISMCGFVINDLHDIEKDSKNHPERPLPSKRISPIGACIIYFGLLTISLLLIKMYIDTAHVYLYLILLLALINYNYVVLYFPAAKDFYVAAVGTIPVIILSYLLFTHPIYWTVIFALFLSLVGREMLMDVEDAKGDAETLAKKIGLSMSANVAFIIIITGAVILSTQTHDTIGLSLILLFITSDCVFFYLWKRNVARSFAILCLKLQLLLGIYYLV